MNPNKNTIINLKYGGVQGDSFVTFYIEEQDNKTKLTVCTIVIEDFDDNIPEFKRESCQDGWNYFIKGRFKNYLST